MLEEIAQMQDVTLGRFLSKLHDETLGLHEEPHNFASLLRCACLTYAVKVKGQAEASAQLSKVARRDFGLSSMPIATKATTENRADT